MQDSVVNRLTGNVWNPVAHHQLDIPYARPGFYTIPQLTPGRLMADDFVTFSWNSQYLDSRDYDVLIQSMDTAGTLWRNIGDLSQRVHLPFVKFNPYASIAIVPKAKSLPRFLATLVRGATYIIPNVDKNQTATFAMSRHGGKF